VGLLKALKRLFRGESTAAANAWALIETKSFRCTLPVDWVADLKSRLVAAKGPRGELLQLTVSGLSGKGSAQEARAIVQNVEQRALAAALAAEKDGGFQTTRPLTSRQLPSGFNFHQMVSTSKDEKQMLAQFVVTGPRAVVLATLDLSAASASSIEAVATSLQQIQWAQS
jgi:hypothetical protein